VVAASSGATDTAGSRGDEAAEAVNVHPAVTRLTEAQVQLDDFEVVAQTDVPGLDLVGASQGVHGVVLDLIVGQSDAQGAVGVTQTSGDALVVGIDDVVDIPALAARGVEGVANAELEAGEVGGLVHDHVVPTGGGSRAEGVGHASL